MASPLRSPFRNIANCVVKVLNWSQGKEESEVESNNEQASKSRSVSPEIPKLEEPVKYIMNDENTNTESRQSRSSKKATPKPEVKVATPRSRTKTSAPNSEIRRSRRKLPFEEEQSMSPNQSHDLDVGQRKSRRKLSLQNYDKGESSSKTNTPSKRSTQAKSQTPKKELTPRKSSRRSAVKLDKVDDSEIPKKSPQKKIASDMKMVLKKNKDTSNEWTAITPTKAKISEEDETDKAVKARRTSRRNTPCKRIDSPKKETPVKDSRVQRPSRASKQFPKLKDDEDEDWTLKTKDQESDSEDDFVIKTRSPSKRFTPRKTQTPKKDFTPRKSTRAAAVKQEDEEVPTAPKNLLKTPKRRNCSIEARAHRDTPAKRRKTMTPRIPARSVPLAKDKSSLAEAQLRLHVGAVPDSLPCREDEFAQVLSFTEGKIFDGTGGCMYISGVPGTGKTATVKEVIRTLQSYTDMGDLPAFDFIEINGMRLTEPNQAYSQLWKALTGAKVTTEHAKNLLEKRFTTANAQNSRKQKTSVVLVDELDLLWNRKQSVLYNIFEWPNNKFSKLVILAIANTMDLPERVMINRVSSRIGLTRLTFSPYTHQQLQEIVCSRLSGLSIFDKDAIQLVARKVASLSGDARRALDICRRASEIAESEGKETMVTIGHVTRAHKEMFCSPKMMAIRSCSKYEKVFMQSMVAVFQKIGIEETPFDRVLQSMNEVLKFESLDILSVEEAHAIVGRLSSSRLILTEPGKTGRLDMKIRLNVSQEDVLFALKPE